MGQVSVEWKDTLGKKNGKHKELGSKSTTRLINTVLPGSIRAEAWVWKPVRGKCSNQMQSWEGLYLGWTEF